MKAEADNSNFNFSQLCDDVSLTIEQLFCHCHCAAHALYFALRCNSFISCQLSLQWYHKKLSVLLNEAKIAALGRALSGTLLLMTTDEWRQRIFYSWVRQPAGGPVSVIPRAPIWLSTGLSESTIFHHDSGIRNCSHLGYPLIRYCRNF